MKTKVIKFCRKPLVASLMVSFVLLLITSVLVYQRYQLDKPAEKFPFIFLLLGIVFSIVGGFLIMYLTRQIEIEKGINKAVLTAQENERMQIGMELHDNVNQILAASGFYLVMAKDNLDDKKKASDLLDELKRFNEQAIDELRRLSHQLAPLVDVSSTLLDKINQLIKNMKLDQKLKVAVRIDKFIQPLCANLQLNFYRILQEQLSNILKYAEARIVEINIESRPKSVLMQIRDDGKGFETSSKRAGIGLENIKRRAALLNGKAKIKSSPGKGCEVIIEIPVLKSS